MIANADRADELDVLADLGRWVDYYLRGDAPPFASLEWATLDDNDPRRLKAAVRAGVAHWRVGASVEELEARVEAAEAKLSSLAISDAEDWTGLAYRPCAVELARRRDWHARAAATPAQTERPTSRPSWSVEGSAARSETAA